MWLISILAVIVWNFTPDSVLNNLAKISEKPHQLCLSYAPKSIYREFYQAIVCGSQLSESFFKIFLKNCGLLHLIVVSGSHLLFLSFFIDKIFLEKIPFRWKFLILFVYALVSKGQPPVVRALTSLAIHEINLKKKFFWTNYQQVWLSLVITLALFPSWILSTSFMMSSCAALALCLSHALRGMQKHFAIYLILLPVLLPLSPPHPMTTFLNALIAPLLGLILFPASLLSFIFPISPLVDQLWVVLDKILGEFSNLLVPLDAVYVSQPLLWSYVAGLNLVAIFVYTSIRRKNAIRY